MELASVLPLAITLAVILVVCTHIAARRRGRARALALAVAAGVLYGVTAGMVKIAMYTLESGLATMLTSWPIYVVIVCGPLGFLLNQNAFQAGVALAPALSLIVVLHPLVGIGIAILWLREDAAQRMAARARRNRHTCGPHSRGGGPQPSRAAGGGGEFW